MVQIPVPQIPIPRRKQTDSCLSNSSSKEGWISWGPKSSRPRNSATSQATTTQTTAAGCRIWSNGRTTAKRNVTSRKRKRIKTQTRNIRGWGSSVTWELQGECVATLLWIVGIGSSHRPGIIGGLMISMLNKICDLFKFSC